MSEKLPQPETNPALDKQWYEQFRAIANFAAFDYLEGDVRYRNEERRKFEAGETENPTLDYPKLKPEDLENRDEALQALKQDILDTDTQNEPKLELIKQVYRWKINEKLADARLLKAAATGDTRRFSRYNRFIYGQPSRDVFAYTINKLHDQIEEHLTSDNEALRRAAAELQTKLPARMEQEQPRTLPDTATLDKARDVTLAELGLLINVPQTDEELDATAIKQAFDYAIEQAKLEGWHTVIDPNRANVSVNQEKLTTYIPENRKLTSQKLSELVLHEIGTHVVRRKNGERSKLMLLGLGLDRYRSDEGVTGLREQILKEKMEDFSGETGHLAIGLATGLDGTPRDFRQVHEILRPYFLREELAKGTPEETAREKADKSTWARCVRTFRGTDCKTPGAVFMQDIIYREANMDVWEVVRTNPNEMLRFSVGKYDPANPRHVMILDQLGITDEDLQELES